MVFKRVFKGDLEEDMEGEYLSCSGQVWSRFGSV